MHNDLVQIQSLLQEDEPKVAMALRIVEDLLASPEATESATGQNNYDVRWLRQMIVERMMSCDSISADTVEGFVNAADKICTFILEGTNRANS